MKVGRRGVALLLAELYGSVEGKGQGKGQRGR